MEDRDYVKYWLEEIKGELGEESTRTIHDTLLANDFSTRLKLKLLNDEQLQIMFSGSNKLGLGSMALLKFKLSQLKEESPLVKGREKRANIPNAKGAKTEGTKGLKALDFEKERMQDELSVLNEELSVLQVKLESRENAIINQPPAIGNSKMICGNCHIRGHRNIATNPCNISACPGFTFCGIKDRHPEYIGETNQVKVAIKQTKEKIQNLENQLNALKDFDTRSEYQFIKALKPRLIAMHKSYEQNKVLLMRHLRLLRAELKGKIPPVTANDAEQLKILLNKCTAKMQKTIGDEYDELIHDTSEINNTVTTSVKNSGSASNVNIFTGNSIRNISPEKSINTKQEAKLVTSDAMHDSSSSESSIDEKHSKKRKSHKRRRKEKRLKDSGNNTHSYRNHQRENSSVGHSFPYFQTTDPIHPNYYPLPYSLFHMPYQYPSGVPSSSISGIPTYNFTPQVPQHYGAQFNVACNHSAEGSLLGAPQQHSHRLASYTTNGQSVCEPSYATVAPSQTSLQPLDALVTAVELTENVDKLE